MKEGDVMPLGFTVDYVAGKHVAYCHHCPLVMRRERDELGLLLAIDHHVTRRH
jgi:hypothetical protein